MLLTALKVCENCAKLARGVGAKVEEDVREAGG